MEFGGGKLGALGTDHGLFHYLGCSYIVMFILWLGCALVIYAVFSMYIILQ